MPRPLTSPPRIRGWIASLALALALLSPTPLVAAEIGTVVQITESTDGAAFKGVTMSAGTVCMRGGISTPLRPGLAVEDGDRLVSQHARVTLEIGEGVQILLAEGADVTIGQRRVEQSAGIAFYQVDAPYEVAAGKVIIAVEGTRFAVEGGDTVVVSVDQGQVRVTGKEEPVLLTRGEAVETKQGHIPGGVHGMSLAERRETWGKTWLSGEPGLRAGFLAGGGYVGGFAPSARLWASLRLPAHLGLLVDIGAGVPFGRGGVLAPAGLGIGYNLGLLTLGAEGLAAFDTYPATCGGSYSAIHFGGVVLVQTDLLLARRLSFVSALRAGYVGGPLVDLGLGLGMGF